MREIVIRGDEAVQAGSDGPGDLIRRLKETAERSLYVFAKSILGWRLLTPNFHGPLCKQIQQVPPRRKGFLLPRDTFKTTLAKSLVIHMTIQPEESNIYFPGIAGSESRILYCCETTDRAETRIRAIKETYETNQLLKAFWPEVLWDDPSLAKAKWNQERLLLRRNGIFDECTIERTGVNAAITGGHFDAFIKDDLIARKAANEPTTMQDAINWNRTSYALANDPETVLEWYFGTHWAASDLYTDVETIDPYNEALDEGVKWYKRAIIENGASIFPERFTMERIQHIRSLDEDIFFLNYMNTVVGSKMQDFDSRLVREFHLDGDTVSFAEIDEDDDLVRLFKGEELEPGSKFDATFQSRLARGTIVKFT